MDFEPKSYASASKILSGDIAVHGGKKVFVKENDSTVLSTGVSHLNGSRSESMQLDVNIEPNELVDRIRKDPNVSDEICYKFLEGDSLEAETTFRDDHRDQKVLELSAGFHEGDYLISVRDRRTPVSEGESELGFYGRIKSNKEEIAEYVEEFRPDIENPEKLIERAFEEIPEEYDRVLMEYPETSGIPYDILSTNSH
jgi:hypothetical protein